MANSKETVICTYRVISGKEEAFEKLLHKHWPALHDRQYRRGETNAFL